METSTVTANPQKPQAMRELLPYVATALTLMGVWWVVSLRLPAFILPPLQVVLPRLVRELSSAEYLAAVGISLRRLAAGYSVALLQASRWACWEAYGRRFASMPEP